MVEHMTNAKYKYWKRRRNNLCVTCGEPTDGTIARCPICAKKSCMYSAKSTKKRLETLKARIAELEGDGMKTLLEKADTQLEQATRGGDDRCDIMYAAGYRQAILDVARKLNDEGLDELEDE